MFRYYVEVVGLVRPSFLLLENVKGIDIEFDKKDEKTKRKRGRPPKPFSRRISEALEKIGYTVSVGLVKALDYGDPQTRPRYFVFAIAKTHLKKSGEAVFLTGGSLNPLTLLEKMRDPFLLSKGLLPNVPVTVRDAISDLETNGKKLVECKDSSGFKQISYN